MFVSPHLTFSLSSVVDTECRIAQQQLRQLKMLLRRGIGGLDDSSVLRSDYNIEKQAEHGKIDRQDETVNLVTMQDTHSESFVHSADCESTSRSTDVKSQQKETVSPEKMCKRHVYSMKQLRSIFTGKITAISNYAF